MQRLNARRVSRYHKIVLAHLGHTSSTPVGGGMYSCCAGARLLIACMARGKEALATVGGREAEGGDVASIPRSYSAVTKPSDVFEPWLS